MIGNSLGTVPLHVLTTRAESTLEPSELGFENEVQDISGYPSVGFVWSQSYEKIF